MDEEEYYGQIWGAPLEAPSRQETQNSFNITTREQLRHSHEKADVYSQVSKSKLGVPKSDNVEENNSVVPNEFIESLVDFNVFLLETGKNKVRGILELSTLHHVDVNKARTRIVCLFDVSGSMLLKCGRSGKDSKLTKLRKMASELIDVLEDDEDSLGIVTFGETSTVVFPLSKINQSTRETAKRKIETIDHKMSSHTDLSKGISTAIEMFQETDNATKHMYINAIIIFSDGEINKGTTLPDSLVHETREKIRNSKPPIELQTSLWLSVSCVTTGGNVSEAMYLLSKFCGNDSYYYIDSKVTNPELSMMIPFILRKSSIAQYVTLNVTSENGAQIDSKQCTQKHSVREKRKSTNINKKISYYLHDFPSGHQKHFAISLDLDSFQQDTSCQLVKLELEFVDNNGNIRNINKAVEYRNILTTNSVPSQYDTGLLLLAKSDMREALQIACRKSADLISQGSPDNPAETLEDGKKEIERIQNHCVSQAKQPNTKSEIMNFGNEVTKNFNNLMETMNKSLQGDGHKWTKLKAVSSSIAREMPNVANLISGSEKLCPLPSVKNSASTRMTILAKKIFQEQQSESEMADRFSERLRGAALDIAQSLGTLIQTLSRTNVNPMMAFENE